MKLNIVIDPHHEEEVVVWAHQKTKLVQAIEQLVTEDATLFIGYKEKEAIRLSLADIHCFVVEDNRIYALTQTEKLQLKSRLYQIEEKLPATFVKINQSCLANITTIERFDASISGTLMIRFKNGHTDYVSRRNLRSVKERLGL